jgi:hypothetical protein
MKRKGKERKGKERKGKERKGKDRRVKGVKQRTKQTRLVVSSPVDVRPLEDGRAVKRKTKRKNSNSVDDLARG